MSLQDPIADMLTRIRNAQRAKKKGIVVASSNMKVGIAKVLKEEGYISGFDVLENGPKKTLVLGLKYCQDRPVIDYIKRVSKTSCRHYASKDDLPVVLGGLGISIVSTSKGIMTADQARAAGIGGEVICEVY